MVDLVLCPALLMGIVIAAIEFGFVHSDEPGGVGLHHAAATFIPTTIFVFGSMNIAFVIELLNLGITENPAWDMGIRAGFALVAMIWINGKAAIGRGVGEKLPHSIGIAALIFAASYIWDLFLKAAIGGMIPC